MNSKLTALQDAPRKLSDTLSKAIDALTEAKPTLCIIVYQDPVSGTYYTWADGHKNRDDVANQLGMLEIAKFQVLHEEDMEDGN